MKTKVTVAGLLLCLILPLLAQPGQMSPEEATGRYTACKSNLKNIGTSCEMYASDNQGHYPKSLKALLSAQDRYGHSYLKTLPTCSVAKADTYSATYKSSDVKGHFHFSLYCQGHHHQLAGSPANKPAYDSEKGLVTK